MEKSIGDYSVSSLYRMLQTINQGTCSPLFECFFATREQIQETIDEKRSSAQSQEKKEKLAAAHTQWKEFLQEKYSSKES